MIGTTLGRFLILEPLGAGGMGEVYLAEDPILGRRLAVKVLAQEFSADTDRRGRLLLEARAASALNHPNIVVVHDIGETGGVLWVAMERIEGETLRTWATPRRSPVEILKMMRQAVAALGVAHVAGLVHRDLKPENMMVRGDGILKILDFGLARSVSPGTMSRTTTMPGVILGTAPYMSPEQVLGQPAGPSSDLFSLGTIFYELLTGVHPFAAASAVETMHRILHESPELPSRVDRALTADFDFVLNKMLAKEPSRRHATAHDLDVDLETLECGCFASFSGPDRSAKSDEAGPRAIAVLPFKNIGGDRELAYLGIGLADAVITRLSTSPDLIVRATSSIARYEGQAVDPRHVGQELDVSAVLDASFQRAGGRFRATARLVETPSGRALWAGKVDVGFEDIFDVQDQVAQGIAEALAAPMGAPASKGFVPDPRAYELILRAVKAANAATGAAYREALGYAEQALAIQPDYAHARAMYGALCIGMVDGGFDSDPAWFEKAERALRRALELDPNEPQGRMYYGNFALTQGRKREAWDALLAASRLAPNIPLLYHFLAYLFRLCSMMDEALAAERHGMAIDPSVPWTWFGVVRMHLLRGETDEARAEIDRARSRFPGHPRLLSFEAQCVAAEGRFEEALDMLRGIDRRGDATDIDRLDEALLLARLGREGEARVLAAASERSAWIDMDNAAFYAAVMAHLGERDAAFASLERAVALGNDSLAVYRLPDRYGPLQGDARWAPFVDGVERRVAEWKKVISWPLPAE